MSRGRGPRTGRAPPESIEVGYPLPIPASVTHITWFRISGNENEGEISLLLIRRGWDPKARNHIRDVIINEKIAHKGSYFETNPEHDTLALWLRGTRRTAVSLVAVEFGY